ncbi:MAG: sulfotransferase domain-containing protein [Acidobacteriota bacterium]
MSKPKRNVLLEKYSHQLKSYVPSKVRTYIYEQTVQRRSGKADYALPDYIIIGAQRSGSTSLYNYLTWHPDVDSAITKEIHFFNFLYDKGIDWYKSHFAKTEYLRKNGLITGEASPYYIYSQAAPRRIREHIPEVKLIALLRNPINRALSNFNMHEPETRSFERAVLDEMRLITSNHHVDFHTMMESFEKGMSYLLRGIYIEQLQPWFEIFPKEQILALKSEDLYGDTRRVYERVTGFLGLRDWQPKRFEPFEQRRYSRMEPELRERLAKFFAPYNERLYEFLGSDFGWEKESLQAEGQEAAEQSAKVESPNDSLSSLVINTLL